MQTVGTNCPARPPSLMHLLYLDDSGSVGNPGDKHIILAGLAVFERQPHWFSKRLDEIASRLWPDAPTNLEFRGADIWGGKKQWRGIGKAERIEAYKDALRIIGSSNQPRLFGAVIHKAAFVEFVRAQRAIEQNDETTRSACLVAAGVTMAALMWSTLYANDPVYSPAAWLLISVGILPALWLLELNRRASVKLCKISGQRRQLENTAIA